MEEEAEIQENHDLPEFSWEERSLHLLQNSRLDKDFAKLKCPRKGGKKHRVRCMSKPMAIPEVILELQEPIVRESALRCLSTFLLEFYQQPSGRYWDGLSESCDVIMEQELLSFFRMIGDQNPSVRSSKRLANVLTLFQCIAANRETRLRFIDTCVPNLLQPVILFQTPLEVFENVRAVALSVIAILCQAGDPTIIQWAVKSDMVEICCTSIAMGNELTKVVGMHILEAIMQDESGLCYICSPMSDHLLQKMMTTWEHLVNLLAVDDDFSPRLLFHSIRCYFLACCDVRGLSLVKEKLPKTISNGFFLDIVGDFPLMGDLLQELLLTVDKIYDFLPDNLDDVYDHIR
ncbi:Cell differentiation protein rcd1 [Vitis vinifera]|uniref:Cell differentiation protein rcd1 n=1 Tax=Vitis vinifera TaxID=29760 RepID=A0A438HV81_VITVI|nr:Cell differentiation protein rcd1 [Vitis vinifera]